MSKKGIIETYKPAHHIVGHRFISPDTRSEPCLWFDSKESLCRSKHTGTTWQGEKQGEDREKAEYYMVHVVRMGSGQKRLTIAANVNRFLNLSSFSMVRRYIVHGLNPSSIYITHCDANDYRDMSRLNIHADQVFRYRALGRGI
jgi:hypothetical protein